MMLREKIRKDIFSAIKDQRLEVRIDEVEVTKSNDQRFGDYTTNFAFRLSSSYSSSKAKRSREVSSESSSRPFDKLRARTIRTFKQSPLEFAKVLAGSLKDQPYIKKLEVKEPGFLNFFIKDKVLVQEVESLLKKDNFESQYSGKKVIVEYTDPNPFKEFHIGHLFSNSVGESISRILEATGAHVKRANYQGDVGLHVAKCLWGMRKNIKYHPSNSLRMTLRLPKGQISNIKYLNELKKASLSDKIRFLQEAYSLGAQAYETDSKAREEITALNKEIYEKQEAIEEYKLGKVWSLENFEEIYKRLGVHFDFYYFESEVGTFGLELVKKHLKDKIFEESQGAIIFPGEKYGLHNRVFVTSQNLPTYEAKELGLAFKKFADFAYDKSIIVTGSEIVDYFKVLLAALAKIDPSLAAKTLHVPHGMVRMPGGKISSRLGNVISATWLLDEAKKLTLILAKEKGLAKETDVTDVAEMVAVGAVKYALLKGNAAQDIKFSFEEAVTLEGNSGPYLQYTYARCKSVISKSPAKGEARQGRQEFPLRQGSEGQAGVKSQEIDLSSLEEGEDMLLRTLVHFEETVVDAADLFAPNIIANYLYELAQAYNAFYNSLRIIDASEPARSRRLFLTTATADTLKRGLFLLGIEAPEKM